MNTRAQVQRYYIVGSADKERLRLIRATNAVQAVRFAFKPLLRVATTDDVLLFIENGGMIEDAS